MTDTPQIFGQQLPPANIDTNLMTVANTDEAMVNIFVANQSTDFDYFSIAVIPFDQSEQAANFVAYQTPLIGGGLINLAQIYLNSGDRIQVSTTQGACSFTATGVLYSGPGAEPYVPIVTGSIGGNTALASLVAALANIGLIINDTTA
jgi:hypothetical protein